MESEIFSNMPPAKLFLRCAVPSMITMVFGAVYQMADGLFVGRFIGEEALAAINLISPVIMIVFAVSNMIATGSSVRIAILLGEKKREEASRVFSFSIKVIMLISCALGILGLLLADPLLRLIAPGASETAISYGVTYTRVYAAFAPLLLVYYATDNYLRLCGKANISMWVAVISQGLNVVLDTIMIVLLGQGVWAAAFTSCISMALGSVFTLLMFKGKRLDIYYTKGNISASTFLYIIFNGSSEFFSNIADSIMSVIFNLFLLKYGGTTAVAAFSVIMYIDGIFGMFMFGMCDALQPAISYCYGAGLRDRVKTIFRHVIFGAVALSAISMLFMIFAGPSVAHIFIKPGDTALLAISITAIKLFSLSYLTGWIDTCFSSYFTAVERPMRSLITSFFGTIVFPVISLFALTPVLKLNGVWLTPAAAGAASAVLTVILALTMRRKSGN